MADAASSAFLQVVFQIAANFIIQEMRLVRDLQNKIEDLKNNAGLISATLKEAEKISPSESLKLWLNELRDVGYEAIDLLDEHNYELQRRKSVHLPEIRSKLSSINFRRTYHGHDMSKKIEKVSNKMNRVFETRKKFGLHVNGSSSGSVGLEITTSIPPAHLVGREDEANKILNMLIPNGNVQYVGSKLFILAIHGMGRIGKTTLAQLIYNDKNMQRRFDMRLWVHVSHEFDLEKVTRSILGSIGELSSPGINLDNIQSRIQEKLNGKKYLLVLDNFWNENRHEWEKLIRPLHKGAVGSVIIVTTRTELVAKMVSTFRYELKTLSENDCYSLVEHYTSCKDELACAKLYALKSEIFIKCGGMPEEAIDLGDRLRGEPDREKWNEIIEKWGMGRNIFNESMGMSYSYIPSNLKPCLAYCSIIPKGLLFEKEWVVQLWIALNFILKQSEERIEDVGDNYFSWFVERSFFQRARVDLNGDRYKYCIPDMVYKVAQQASVEECCIFEHSKPRNLTKVTKHMSIIFTEESPSYTRDPFTVIQECEDLYTLLIFGGSSSIPLMLPDDIFKRLRKLRILDLNNCNIVTLPNNIGDLKHLCYLQLQNTKILELPESICNLYNLQTLGLRNCFELRKLPSHTSRLHKLRHLDLHLDYKHPTVNQSCENLESMP